tara:strand:+ start:1293 stop:1448 length:156 start_codon:yes stop_codon:yes gene_type:complete
VRDIPIKRVIIKDMDIVFFPLELELVQKYEMPNTAATNNAIGRINLIIFDT